MLQAYLPRKGQVEVVIYRNEHDQHSDGEDRLNKACTTIETHRIFTQTGRAGPGDKYLTHTKKQNSPYMHTLLAMLPFLTSLFHTLLLLAALLQAVNCLAFPRTYQTMTSKKQSL